MRVTMLLADAVQAVDGKLYILGGGWSLTGPAATAMGIAMKIDVPWDQTNRRHEWMLRLIDADGHVVTAETPEGARPIEIGGQFEVGRPPGLPPGTPIDLPIAINLPPLPLPPGRRLVWQLAVDDETNEDWQLAFNTRPAAT
jgi:hypothetical protein